MEIASTKIPMAALARIESEFFASLASPRIEAPLHQHHTQTRRGRIAFEAQKRPEIAHEIVYICAPRPQRHGSI